MTFITGISFRQLPNVTISLAPTSRKVLWVRVFLPALAVPVFPEELLPVGQAAKVVHREPAVPVFLLAVPGWDVQAAFSLPDIYCDP